MTRSVLPANIIAFSLAIMLCAACSQSSYTDSNVDQCLKAAHTASSNNDPGAAEQQLQKAVELAQENKGVPLMKALNALSFHYHEHGKFELCRELLLKSKDTGEQLLEDHPSINDAPQFQTEYLTTMVALANWERDMGHFDTAKRYYGVAMPINERLGEQSPVKNSLAGDYRKCISEQDTQEGVENLLVSDKNITDQRKNNSRTKFGVRYKQIMDGYDAREPRESEEMFVSLINDVRKEWGLEEQCYRVSMSGLLEVSQRTGNFFHIDEILAEDIHSMAALDEKTSKGLRVGPAEVVELGNFIDTLIWQARAASAKRDYATADQKATRALKLTEEYYPESGDRLEECWRSLEEYRLYEGDFKSANQLTEHAIKELNRRDPNSSFLVQHYLDLALSHLGQGQLRQAVSIAESLLKIPTGSVAQKNAYRLTALRILFEVDTLIDDYDLAGKTHRKIADMLDQNKGLHEVWGLALLYQAQRLMFECDKFAEYAKANESINFDRNRYYWQWLFSSDLMSYAALRAGQADKALQYCKNVESADRNHYTDSLFYSKIVRVWLDAMSAARSSSKKSRPAELDRSVNRMVACIEKLSCPSRMFAVKPLVALAKYLTDSGFDSDALKVYSCALSAYDLVPTKVDQPLIEALAGYRKLMEKLDRREEAWQTNARLEQKQEKFAALVSITKDSLKRANLL